MSQIRKRDNLPFLFFFVLLGPSVDWMMQATHVRVYLLQFSDSNASFFWKYSILVNSGYCKKNMADWVVYKTQTFTSTVLEARKLRIVAPAFSVWVVRDALIPRWLSFCWCPHRRKGARAVFLAFDKGAHLFYQVSSLMTQSPPIGPCS